MTNLTDYDPNWPTSFQTIVDDLRPKLRHCDRIEHVGSTSVPGMIAKPVIDINIVVDDGAMPDAIASIVDAGYAWQGDLGIPGCEAFIPRADSTKQFAQHRIYACEKSSLALRRHIDLRDYLVTHPQEAARLADLKRQLISIKNLTKSDYRAEKSSLICELTDSALAWRLKS